MSWGTNSTGIKNADTSGYVVGIDLSGDEDSAIPDDAYVFFASQGRIRPGVTIHAGETGNIANVLGHPEMQG